MSKMNVKQGESTDIFLVTVEGVADYSGYYSRLTIIDASTDELAGDAILIAPVDNKFHISLSPEQTLVLPVGSYTAVLEVIKEVEGVAEFRKEISWALKVSKSLVS